MSFSWASEPVYIGWLFFAFDFGIRLWFGARIIRRKLPSSVAWAWLSVILFLPIFGTILYLFFGELRQAGRRQRRLERAASTIVRMSEHFSTLLATRPNLSPEETLLAKAFHGMMGSPPLGNNHIELLPDAAHAFPRLIADLDQAAKSIDLEFYIWSGGGRADDFGRALMRAAQRGVKCRVLIDAIGSSAFIRSEFCSQMRTSGVNVVVALPSGFWRSLFARPDLRIHRKIIVIDQTIAYTGSMNMADPALFKKDAGVGQWVDTLARIKGPAVLGLFGVFLSDWCAETGDDFAQFAAQVKLSNLDASATSVIQCMPSGPAVKNSAIEQALIMTIYSAREEIILTTPYFVPSEALMYALVGAARRGVRTTLIVPETVDSKLTHYASRSFLQDLIEVGITVALYRPGLLHTKSVTVDRQFSLFGSLNLDPRSLRINFEITIAVYDPEFTRSLIALQDTYLKASSIYTMHDVQEQSALAIWKGNLARLLGPLL